MYTSRFIRATLTGLAGTVATYQAGRITTREAERRYFATETIANRISYHLNDHGNDPELEALLSRMNFLQCALGQAIMASRPAGQVTRYVQGTAL